jgi:hypothetical protein
MPRTVRITVKPNSKKEGVEPIAGGELRVSVHAPPREGEANEAVVRLLADYFSVPKTSITIRHGRTGRRKLVHVG